MTVPEAMTVGEDTQRIPRMLGDVREQHPPVLGVGSDPSPVFVDPSGRRQRRVRRLGRLLVVPAAGYVALLVSTVLGGPTVDTPLIPLPQAPHPAGSTPAVAPVETPAPGSPTAGATGTAAHLSTPPRSAATGSAVRPASSAASAGPATSASGGPATPTASATPTVTGTPTATHGRASSPPGASHKPTHT